MAERHLNIQHLSSQVNEDQNMLRFHLIAIRMAKINKTSVSSWCGVWGMLLNCLVEYKLL